MRSFLLALGGALLLIFFLFYALYLTNVPAAEIKNLGQKTNSLEQIIEQFDK
jgi:hypothetical protein